MPRSRSFGIWLALCLSTLSLAAHAQTTYTTERVTTTPRVAILGLNDKGEMVGTDFQNNYLWRKNGRQIQLPGLPGVTALQTLAVAINNRSQIIGYTSVPYHGFLLRHKVILDLGDLFPSDINNAGQIVGSSGAMSFLWQAGTIQIYDGPSGSINDFGDVVGGAVLSSDQIMQGGVVTTLEPLPGRGMTLGFDINNHAQVVGWSLPGPPPSIGQAFFWQAGEARLLPKLQPSPQTYARSINDSEVIVGFSEGVGVEATALVWLNGNVYSLTELISPDESLRPYVRLRHAWKVNNRGQILVDGIDVREPDVFAHFLLTPVRGRR